MEDNLPYLIHKLLCLLPLYAPDRAHFLIVKRDTIEFISGHEHLWSKGRCNKLRGLRKFMYHSYTIDQFQNILMGRDITCYCCPILRVKIGVDL